MFLTSQSIGKLIFLRGSAMDYTVYKNNLKNTKEINLNYVNFSLYVIFTISEKCFILIFTKWKTIVIV